MTEENKQIECRLGCGACCIIPSISSSIPGMPGGKPSMTRCIQLDEKNLCKLFGHPERPKVCSDLKASEEMCGKDHSDAFNYLEQLEVETAP
ncbi:YkgJ family cysteine cluster protein [Fusibacter sp. A1]|uniref:YkgJ family cysteine cluster protein n=1 Tax=Fusibacter sp. A1 TaxID=2283630 RepID=UPI0013E99D9D|nr:MULTISPECIES: YkgJ family cysteine cluster protein [unclassified Fusibacter]NPE22166.1 YkgJ family cysteine cluster protein [Fusibacter sp. A1]